MAHEKRTTTSKRREALTPPRDLVEAPGYGARRLYQAYVAAWSRFVDATFTGPQFALLSVIRAYPERDQTTLAGAVSLDTSTMADLCRRMERRGLIERKDSRQDARAKLLSLTPQGESALKELNKKARALDPRAPGLNPGC